MSLKREKLNTVLVEWSGVERLFFLFFVLSFDRVEITTAPEEKTFAI
jgi:hypothetical protein